MALLDVQNLKVEFHTDEGIVRAVNDVSFHLNEREILGIVGESGSGKSVSCMALMGLLPMPPARIPSGQIFFEGADLLKKNFTERRKIRGKDISMIFQDPFTALNPYLKISTQMNEVLQTHTNQTKTQIKKRCLEVLDSLGVPEAEVRYHSYPHQLSGGLKQRVLIAMSLLLEPKIIIADEPTTALDVTIQAQIMDLLKKINKDHGTAILLITHDLGVVAGMCDRIQVMYGGRIIEQGTNDELFYETRHPYTKGLLDSIPSLETEPGSRLTPIPGSPPDLTMTGDFCSFADRCSRVQDRCWEKRPAVSEETKTHTYECYVPYG